MTQAEVAEREADVWSAVRVVAALACNEGAMLSDPAAMSAELAKHGFSGDTIGKALAWLDLAAASGHLHDALHMLQPQRHGIRVTHPVERAMLHPSLLRRIERCRNCGLLADEMAERLIEGLRTVDTRDWDEGQLGMFIDEVVAQALPGQRVPDLHLFLQGRLEAIYN